MAAILRRGWLFLKRRLWRATFSQMVSPLSYLVTFGVGLGGTMKTDGEPYLRYLISGLLVMTTTRSSYTLVSTRISIMRLHEKSFECCLYSSIQMHLLAMRHILAGILRGMYSGVFIVLSGIVSGVRLAMNGWLLAAVTLDSLIFPALDFLAAIMVESHYDVNNFMNVVIAPMSFLCGTFFSLDGIPEALKWVVNIMPSTHTTRLIREISSGGNVSRLSMTAAVSFAATLIGGCVWAYYREAKT